MAKYLHVTDALEYSQKDSEPDAEETQDVDDQQLDIFRVTNGVFERAAVDKDGKLVWTKV